MQRPCRLVDPASDSELKLGRERSDATVRRTELVATIKEEASGPLPFDAAELARRMFDAFVALAGFYFLSLATVAHLVTSRYGDGKLSPLEIYDQRHALVVHFGDVTSVVEECLDMAQSTFASGHPELTVERGKP